MSDILLITPPFLQPNTPYPANTYLKGYLRREGLDAEQYDLSVELLQRLFSSQWLEQLFCLQRYEKLPKSKREKLIRPYKLRKRYIETIDLVMNFLSGNDPVVANVICTPDFLPQGENFSHVGDLEYLYGQMGITDCAKYLCTLYLYDISDYIRETVSDEFGIARYAEKIAVSLPRFSAMQQMLDKEANLIETEMATLLDKAISQHDPRYISFTIPFPGNLYMALRAAQHIRKYHSHIKIIAGGGYPSTELRNMSEDGIFNYFDHIVFDDGECALKDIVEGKITERLVFSAKKLTHNERQYPDYSGLDHTKYFSLLESENPVIRLWSDGRWNKMMTAHGCYWAKCGFCDTSLDYIGRHDRTDAVRFADWMEQVHAETGSRGFHFTDEAASPKFLKELSIELIRRNSNYIWWTNIRFEEAYTGDLCKLMAAAGCIAVSGGLETAHNGLLNMMGKGISVETATISLRNFFYAGIMTHTYLMYGLPSQTLQDTVDSLEVVRQLFAAELIGSAYWHRFALTIHSPMGKDPEKYGITEYQKKPNPFANNEMIFNEKRDHSITSTGEALNKALRSYLSNRDIAKPAHKWFTDKAPQTTVEPSEITDHLIKPDRSRIYDGDARLVYIGNEIATTSEGVLLFSGGGDKNIKLDQAHSEFVIKVSGMCSDLGKTIRLSEVSELYSQYNSEPFILFYHSKKWDILRKYGLLQI